VRLTRYTAGLVVMSEGHFSFISSISGVLSSGTPPSMTYVLRRTPKTSCDDPVCSVVLWDVVPALLGNSPNCMNLPEM